MIRIVILALMASLAAAAEPPARKLAPAPIKIAAPIAHITAVYELASGKLLVSDVKTPRLSLIDPVTGTVSPVGLPGAAADQYTEPGGFYPGSNGTVLLADHSGPRALIISPAGQITGGYPTAQKGVRSSSDSDTDITRLDGRGFAYIMDRGNSMRLLEAGEPAGTADLVRLDPAKQTVETVAKLMIPKAKRISSENGLTLTRSTVGDPADGWAVLRDGRVAIVRAAPYRVEWIGVDGRSTQGPQISFDPIPYTQQDRDAYLQSLGAGASVGASVAGGGKASTADLDRKFAAVKPPFSPDDVIASPAGRIWVKRSAPFGAATVTYDVFDGTGARVDRVEFPKDSRVVGFGPASVYVREGSGKDTQLRKYKLS
jgi:sugar lactone lactonase YvrE